jgi:hypothetical protein
VPAPLLRKGRSSGGDGDGHREHRPDDLRAHDPHQRWKRPQPKQVPMSTPSVG